MTEKEKAIRIYMKNLNLSRKEAEQMWTDEQEDNFPELTAEQKAVVKEMTQADRKKETTPRKRERKADENKRFLMNRLYDGLYACAEKIEITNLEREIELIYEGEKYKVVLMKPRKEKTDA